MTAAKQAARACDGCDHCWTAGGLAIACVDCIYRALLAHEAEVREECAKIVARERALREALRIIAAADDPENPRKWTMVGIATVARAALAASEVNDG